MPDEPTPQPDPTPPEDAAPSPDDSTPPTPPEGASETPADAGAGASGTAPEASASPESAGPDAASGEAGDTGSLEDEWAAALAEQQSGSDPQAAADAVAEAMAAAQADAGGSSPAASGASPAASSPPAESFEPPPVQPPASGDGFGTLEVLDDVELDLSVELGRTELYIEDVLKLGSGSVIQLDKAAGDPVDIYVNQRLVARGEVLVLNDNFCVRINEIVSPVPELDDPTQ